MTKLKSFLGGVLLAACLFSLPALAIAHQTDSAARLKTGAASWYGPKFHGKLTASGEPFDMNDLTAAHPTLPFGTRVRVTNGANGKSVVVRINDRGPFVEKRVIDLSRLAAKLIGITNSGVARVQLEVLGRI